LTPLERPLAFDVSPGVANAAHAVDFNFHGQVNQVAGLLAARICADAMLMRRCCRR